MDQTSENKFKSNTELFYAKVREEYAKRIGVKSKSGKRVFDEDYIFEVLGDMFFRSPKTIENIVYYRVSVKKKRPETIEINGEMAVAS